MRCAVILAGGSGKRFGRTGGKQLALLDGVPLFLHSLLTMQRCAEIGAIVLVGAPEALDGLRARAAEAGVGKHVATVEGGLRRQDSVSAGLSACPAGTSVVVVHDAARPLVSERVVSAAVAALEADDALDGVVVGHPSYDTMKAVSEERVVLSTLDRATMWAAQTPQVFRIEALRAALEAAARQGVTVTDDAQALELAGGRIAMCEGPRDNIKVTAPEDLAVAEALIAAGRD